MSKDEKAISLVREAYVGITDIREVSRCGNALKARPIKNQGSLPVDFFVESCLN